MLRRSGLRFLSVFTLFFLCEFAHSATPPGKVFDLSQWKITLPVDTDKDGKLDEVPDTHLPKFTYPPFFFLNDKQHMVFISPTKVVSNGEVIKPRSELRQMLRAGNKKIDTGDEKNNFALKSNKRSRFFGSVGGRLEASLMVNHVPKSAIDPNKPRAYTVVIGQLNTGKQKQTKLLKGIGDLGFKSSFGHGNEPIKIYYKKWPHHETGSLFWTYERNLPADDPNRQDVVYPVWGKTWDSKEFPDYEGIALGEEFSYTINIYENTLELTFSAGDRLPVTYTMKLNDDVNAYGELDEYDNQKGYAGDWFYFRVGAYNQCANATNEDGTVTGLCTGSGDWATDYKNGDFSAVTFTKFKLSKPTPIDRIEE